MKQVNSDFTLIGLGITAAVSLVTNVFQALDNRELRKQIEQLTLIVNQLQGRIEELRKQKEALKLFDFRTRSEFQKEIKKLKSEQNIYLYQIKEINRNLN